MDQKYKLFKGGQTVIDLVRLEISRQSSRTDRHALGLCAWELVSGMDTLAASFAQSLTHDFELLITIQVALERTKPNGSIVGVDLIAAPPLHEMLAIQGDFLDPAVQNLIKTHIRQLRRRKDMEKKQRAKSENDGLDVVSDLPSHSKIRERGIDATSVSDPVQTDDSVDVSNSKAILEPNQ
jgi:23S rRNA U2552 (ribose-2'-O)-methylase RlmE/FtsJ